MSDGYEIEDPIIANCAEEFENVLSGDDPESLDPNLRFNLRKAYYSAFARAFSIAINVDPRELEEISELIRDEIRTFNQINREIAKNCGIDYVTIKN